MALRVSKAVLVFAIALFYTILVLNNITDHGSNYEFVRHVLIMDSRRFLHGAEHGQLDSRCTRYALGERVHRVFCFTEPELKRQMN
ncbi:MAG: DUF2165 family protein [Candidatus Sulfotelmatobacter sp.]|jgi:hypothetical protein